MKYLLDTNICVRYINGRSPEIRAKLEALNDRDIAVSTVTMAEMFAGSARSQHPLQSRAKQDAFFVRFTIFPFDIEAAHEFGRIRAHLESVGTPIGPYDMQIAAIAVVHTLTIVTHNTKEFSRISWLKIEDWDRA